MKTITYLLILFVMPFEVFSQKIEKEIANIKTIEINKLYGDLKITGNNSHKIEIVHTGYNEKPAAIKSKANINYKTDNTQLGLNFEFVNNTLLICAAGNESEFGNYEISIPKNLIVKIDNNFLSPSSNYTSTNEVQRHEAMSKLIIKNMKNEIDLSAFIADVKITNINGPVILSAFDGVYNISYAKFGQGNPSMINVKNGEVIVQLPFDSKVNLQIETESGKITSGHVIKNALVKTETETDEIRTLSNKQIKNGNYKSIKGKINKGGNELSISTSKANIKLLATQYPVVVPVVVN